MAFLQLADRNHRQSTNVTNPILLLSSQQNVFAIKLILSKVLTDSPIRALPKCRSVKGCRYIRIYLSNNFPSVIIRNFFLGHNLQSSYWTCPISLRSHFLLDVKSRTGSGLLIRLMFPQDCGVSSRSAESYYVPPAFQLLISTSSIKLSRPSRAKASTRHRIVAAYIFPSAIIFEDEGIYWKIAFNRSHSD